MQKDTYIMRAKVWLYPGIPRRSSGQGGSWHFITLPKKQSAEIKTRFGAMKRGWESLPVVATILRSGSGQVDTTSWKTSIFPDKKAGAYLLPLKADIRKKENVAVGDTVRFSIEIKAR